MEECRLIQRMRIQSLRVGWKIMIWREPLEELDQKCTIPMIKQGGGSVIVWVCVTRQRVGKLCVLDRIMDRFYYRDILEQNLQTINQSF